MNILTRANLDGLACCAMLKDVYEVESIRFTHTRDVESGRVSADENDIVVNLPLIPTCGMWFDYHIKSLDDLSGLPPFSGRCEPASCCARVVEKHFQDSHGEAFSRYAGLIDALEMLVGANLTLEMVSEPMGWILLGQTVDLRSGLIGDYEDYFNFLVDCVRKEPLENILMHPEVKKRTDTLMNQQEAYIDMLEQRALREGNVIVTDLRNIKRVPVGSRFLVYAIYSDANVEMRLQDQPGDTVEFSIGQNIFNKSCKTDIGALCREYGGGGREFAGSLTVGAAEADASAQRIFEVLYEQ